jgi:thymidylate synthase ThyX
MTCEVKIIEDTVGYGRRLTTFQLRYPRFIHSELMTHRVFSRNASSSRAIPTAKLLEMVKIDPAMPVYWGKNQSGMQANEELDEETKQKAIQVWLETRDLVVEQTKKMIDLGVHKQIANRMLEPWHYIHVVLTATEFENFFELRCHKDAQPEIKELADMMRNEYNKMSVTKSCDEHWWHLPYVTQEERDQHSLTDLLKISTARCARVSYMNHDGTATDIEKDRKLHDMLVVAQPPHMSPAEHQAVFLNPEKAYGNFMGWKQYRKYLEANFTAENIGNDPIYSFRNEDR